MHLFHWHYWTPRLEEVERFYLGQGFEVRQRMGRESGEWKNFGPPLDWEDFRERSILFRIIEMVKGEVNVTIGQGKKDQFDHAGFAVSGEELEAIRIRAEQTGWSVSSNGKRTFLTTPWAFRIELIKKKLDVSPVCEMHLRLPNKEEWIPGLAYVLGCETEQSGRQVVLAGEDWRWVIEDGPDRKLRRAVLSEKVEVSGVDPVGVELSAIDQRSVTSASGRNQAASGRFVSVTSSFLTVHLDRIRELLAAASGQADQKRLSGLLKEYLDAEDHALFAWLLPGEQVAGIIGLILRGKSGVIGHIAVLPEFRGRGIARGMVESVLKRHHLTVLEAETDAEAVGFYQACGFSVRSLGEKYPGVERFLCEKRVN
jgi:ribosomal protein S18 acetylase RimI-like enzyme